MTGFVFRLQKVLDHRIRIEDARRQAFIMARQGYLNEKELLASLEQKLVELNSRSVEKTSGVYTYIAAINYGALLEERIEKQSGKVQSAMEEMDKKRVKFEESQKDRKVLEKLREKALEEYLELQDKAEQNRNDEFALYGYVRK
jgi:flagellar FliJ protein